MEEKQQQNNYNYSRSLKTILPKLNFNATEDKGEFPNRTRFHYKRTFAKFVTNKNNKENFTPKIVELNLNYANKQQTVHQSFRLNETQFSEYQENTNYNKLKEDNYDLEEKKMHTCVIDMKKLSSNQLEKPFEIKKLKKLKKFKSLHFKETPQLQPFSQQQDELEEEELKKIYCPSPIKTKQTHVIDLNFVSSTSRLSEHYLRPYSINLEQTECSLEKMNLNELWPHSTMVKQSTKSNSWINTFKAKSIANEINRTYCDTADPSRSDYVTYLPSLKTPEINASNSRLDNPNSTTKKNTKKYSFFLPDIKISYCQKQIL